ncbi:MFS transporter [Halobacteriaceae archaeon GCM10025711]
MVTPPTTEPSSARVPWGSRTVQVVLASTVLAPLGVPLVAPALPVIRDTFGVTDARASLLVSAYFVVGVLLSPFIGIVVDRLGRKRVLVASLVAFALAGGAIAFAPTFDAVLVLRALQGTAAAGIFITTVTLIGDSFEGTQRNAVFGVNIAVLSVGAAVFPVVGGALVSVAWYVPFLLSFAALPVAAFALRYLAEPVVERDARSLAYLRGALDVVARRGVVALYGVAFLTEFLLFGAAFTAFPFLLTAEFALAPVVVGLVLLTAEGVSVVVAAKNGWFARRLSNRNLIAVGFACYGVGLLVAWLATAPWLFGVAAIAFGAGVGLSMPAVDAAVSDRVAGTYRAGALSLRNSTTFLGRATGPIAFAGLAVTTGYPTLLLAGGIVALAAAVVATAARTRPKPVEGVVADTE